LDSIRSRVRRRGGKGVWRQAEDCLGGSNATFTETAKATRKKKDIKLAVVDMYIIIDKGISKFYD